MPRVSEALLPTTSVSLAASLGCITVVIGSANGSLSTGNAGAMISVKNKHDQVHESSLQLWLRD